MPVPSGKHREKHAVSVSAVLAMLPDTFFKATLDFKAGIFTAADRVQTKPIPKEEFLKERFPEIRYTDLIFNGGTIRKAAWVLPITGQTAATGTLADFLISLGVDVTEVDLDEEEDESDDEERDEDGLIDDEAEESNGEEEEDEE